MSGIVEAMNGCIAESLWGEARTARYATLQLRFR